MNVLHHVQCVLAAHQLHHRCEALLVRGVAQTIEIVHYPIYTWSFPVMSLSQT